MDYGKLAYMKLEDLEGAQRAAKKTRQRSARALFCPDVEFDDGRVYEAAGVSGGGAAGLVLKVTLQVLSAGAVELLIDSRYAGEAAFSPGASEGVIIASALLNGQSLVALRAARGLSAVLKRAEFIILGEDAAVTLPASDWRCDSLGGEYALITSRDERLSFYTDSAAALADGAELTEQGAYPVGYGSRCDVCMTADGVYALYCDNLDNLWALKLGQNGELARARVGGAADRVALTYHDGRFVAAVVSDGAVACFSFDAGFGSVSPLLPVDMPFKCGAVGFVRGAPEPVLVAVSGGKSYLKRAAGGVKNSDVLGIGINFSVAELA
ncbi:MAG: hypothetical protein LBP26_02620 [Clostridiales bacterium]|jgi:hypothetical protein|nr:hypothetical protein [Clostridiales bacterium]